MRLGEEKKEEEITGKNTMACPITWGGHNQSTSIMQYS